MTEKNPDSDVITPLLATLDGFIEMYLKTFIAPFVQQHEIFYNKLNAVLRSIMDRKKAQIPDWFTANFITYARTALVAPCLIFLSWGWYLLPSAIVLLVDFGDFLDGVAARFWIDVRRERRETLNKQEDRKATAISPTKSDSSFEVVSTGSPHVLESWGVTHRARSYGGFIDAVCDKAFVVPCWISLLHVIGSTGYMHWLQYFVFLWLTLMEVSSACVRFRAYFTATGVAAPKVEGFDFSTSAVNADHVGKAKQTFEMVGTALYLLPFATYIGLGILFLAVPLAYESVRRKIKKRTIYVRADDAFDHKTVKFWMQAKELGSKLIVGVTNADKTDMILNALSTPCVDEVIVEAPEKADLLLLEEHAIDYVLSLSSQPQFVTDEVLNSKCTLVMGDDLIVRPLLAKTEHKD